LLPFERELCQLIGCSEEEYQYFRHEALKRAQARPAAYELVPDAQAGFVVPILISLAVGVVFNVVAALLAPKPQAPRERQQISERSLEGVQGRRRFNATFGFDGQQELASYGSPIAVLFGRYQEHGDITTGGLSVAPQLVWSRMFSYGTQQGFKGLFVLGESLADSVPSFESVTLGTGTLDSLAPERYALYWRPTGGRIKGADLLAGTRAKPEAGDPEVNDDIAMVPTIAGPNEPGFCMTHQPSNNLEFGCYGAIKNGTGYRPNWQVISAPSESGDPRDRIKNERRKIAGKAADKNDQGMPGVGRGYSCCMGLIAHNGTQYEDPAVVEVKVGDEVVFHISGRKLPETDGQIDFSKESGVTSEDIVSSLDGARQAADDSLQIGEMFMIARTLWQVVRRTGGQDGVYELGGPSLEVTLRCTELTSPGNKLIGIAGKKAVITNDVTYEGGDNPFLQTTGWLGPSFYPLTRVGFGVVRNVRVAEMTEIGLRSQVWNQATGLCNFQAIPAPQELIDFDRGNVQLRNGALNKYFNRTSVFTIYLRPSGLQADGKPYEWAPLGEQFCVTGNTPQDQYNFIRLKTLDRPGQFEFRFIPKSGADVVRAAPPDAVFWRLNAKTGSLFGEVYNTPYGRFRLSAVGEKVVAFDLAKCSEMLNGERPARTETVTRVSGVGLVTWLPEDFSYGRHASYFYHLFGHPEAAKNQSRNTTLIFGTAPRTITVEISAVSRQIDDPAYTDHFHTVWRWEEAAWIYRSSTGDWKLNDEFRDEVTYDSSNLFCQWDSRRGGALYRVSNTETVTINFPSSAAREFERFTGYVEVSHYDEVVKSCDQGPEHQIVYVNEAVDNGLSDPEYTGLSMVGLALRSGRDFRRLDQLRLWLPNGISCRRFYDNSFGPSNLFCDLAHFFLTDVREEQGALALAELVNDSDFARTARFLTTNRIFFDGVVSEASNLRSFLTRMAPLHLCNFVIANGQFSVTPALPCDDSGAINPANVPIAMMFSEGNIIENSYEVSYLDADQRRDFRAVMSWRVIEKDKLPETKTTMVCWKEDTHGKSPQEVFDLTQFCTSREHAMKVARMMLSVRRRVDHAISFKTTPFGINLAPGNYIKVVTESAPYSAVRNGVVSPDDGHVISVSPLKDGDHRVMAYRPGADAVEEITIAIKDGVITDRMLWGTVFTALVPKQDMNVYQVERLELDDDGVVSVTASHFPVENGRSVIADDVLDASRFVYYD
jgi:hypothetical protein